MDGEPWSLGFATCAAGATTWISSSCGLGLVSPRSRDADFLSLSAVLPSARNFLDDESSTADTEPCLGLLRSANQLSVHKLRGTILAEDLAAKPTMVPPSHDSEVDTAVEAKRAFFIWHPSFLPSGVEFVEECLRQLRRSLPFNGEGAGA